MPITYKPLFEVKLMHEYYLTRQNGSVIFEESAQSARLDFLRKEFEEGRASINDDLRFEFPEFLKSKYEGLYLKLIPTYSGCKVAVRVSSIKLNDQSTIYKPIIPLPDDLKIFILLTRKNNNIDTYTNGRIKRPYPSIYFFSNFDVLTPGSFPFLTNNIPAENSSVIYEQGELALSSSNIIREFFRQGNTDQWSEVKGTGFANESDRLLVPEKFYYSFSKSPSITQASFFLKDNNGKDVWSFSTSNNTGIGDKCFLDFSGKVKSIATDTPIPLSSFIYTLEARINNSLAGNHQIIFSNELTSNNPWAVIDTRTIADNSAFNLFATDKNIIYRKDPFGIVTPAPVFEIPVKSRLAYWRFIHNSGKALNVSLALTDYINKEGTVLVTKKPRSLAMHSFLLRRDPPPGEVYVPNPVSQDLIIGDDRRIFYNIRVPTSELFPI